MNVFKATLAPAILLPTLVLAFQSGQEGPTPAELRRASQIEKLQLQQEEAKRERLADNVLTLRELQGAWQLTEFIAPDLEDAGRQSTGFLLIGDEFLSLEVHMAFFDEEGREESSFIQTGTYRLNFNTFSDLIAMCLIGSIDDGGGLTMPQTPGVVSVYSVDVRPLSLHLLGEDGAKLTFERVARGALTDLLYSETDWLPGAEGREAPRAVQNKSPEKAKAEDAKDK